MEYKIKDMNESYSILTTDNMEFKKRVCDTLSVFEDGYKFSAMFRSGLWDGKKKFYKILPDYSIVFPKGLVQYIIKDLVEHNYEYTYDRISEYYPIERDGLEEFIETLNLPFPPYDYQVTAALNMIKYKRGVMQAATGSGKSLMIYIFFMFMKSKQMTSVLVVPSISLVSQMYSDFKDYGMKDSEKYIKQIGGEFKGNKDLTEKPIIISTWQSLKNFESEQFSYIDALVVDECHTVSGDVLTSIINKSYNSQWKCGLTGTVPRGRVPKMQLLGTLGRVYKIITPGGLIARGLATPIRINCLYFDYVSQDMEKVYKEKMKYPDEEKFINQHWSRNIKTAKILSKLSNSGNVLGLFSKIAHGELILEKLILERTGNDNFQILHKITPKPLREAYNTFLDCPDRLFYMNSPIDEESRAKVRKYIIKTYGEEKVEDFIDNIRSLTDINIFFITGDVDGLTRENIRATLETVHVDEGAMGAIILGSYAIVATGINYKNLRHIVYCSSLKSYIKIVQSIGRGMRLHAKKSVVDVWDIVDNLAYTKYKTEKQNYMLKHFYERVEFYREAEYQILEKTIKL